MIVIDFMTGLPRTTGVYNDIWVIVDRLTKLAHFLSIKKTYTIKKFARLYINRIVCLYGVPESIMSNRGENFTLIFWQELHKALDTRIDFNTTFHP